MPAKIQFNKKQKTEIISLHKDGLGIRKISKSFNCSITPIKKVMLEFGEPFHSSKIFSLDENYFEEITNENKAYWLGFIYADGSVRLRDRYPNKKWKPSIIYEFKIKLGIKDKEHLEKFRDEKI